VSYFLTLVSSLDFQMLENTQNELQTRLDAQSEWLLIRASGKSFALQNAEIELQFGGRKTAFRIFERRRFSNLAHNRLRT
jgi:hypothetical protein